MFLDWFTEWPEDALEKVATSFLQAADLKTKNENIGTVEMFSCQNFYILTEISAKGK